MLTPKYGIGITPSKAQGALQRGGKKNRKGDKGEEAHEMLSSEYNIIVANMNITAKFICFGPINSKS